MAATLRQFLSELATNPEKLAAYQKDPDTALADSGLSAEDQQALRSRDPAAIQARLGSGGSPGFTWMTAQATGAPAPSPVIWSAAPHASPQFIWPPTTPGHPLIWVWPCPYHGSPAPPAPQLAFSAPTLPSPSSGPVIWSAAGSAQGSPVIWASAAHASPFIWAAPPHPCVACGSPVIWAATTHSPCPGPPLIWVALIPTAAPAPAPAAASEKKSE